MLDQSNFITLFKNMHATMLLNYVLMQILIGSLKFIQIFNNFLILLQGELLVENLTDNRLLLNWSYPCVTNVLKKRYCSNQTELTLTHQKIAEYFLGTRSSNRTQDSFDNKSDVASQCLSQQPLLHSETLYNLRPLTEIWFQLLQTGKQSPYFEYPASLFKHGNLIPH